MTLHLRSARIEDCPQIAEIHRSGIQTGFLSDLGLPFLTLLYQSMISSRKAFCKIAHDGARVIGFISGAETVGGFYREFLHKTTLKVVLILIRKMVNPKTIVKIFETLFYPARKQSLFIHAEIFSIVVDPRYQGRGIAQWLFTELRDEFERRGTRRFKVVAGSQLTAACRFYEKTGGILSSELEVHRGEKSKVYVWDID